MSEAESVSGRLRALGFPEHGAEVDRLVAEIARMRAENEQLRIALDIMRKDYDLLKQLAEWGDCA